MTKNYISFNGGISTEPEVNDLIEQIGIPVPGDQISYLRISEIIKVKKGTSRWSSVVSAWRKKLERQHNVILGAVPNEGYEVLSNSGRVNLGGKFFKESLRRMGRAVKVVTSTDRAGLSDDEVKAAEHIQKTGASLRLAAQTAARQLAYPDPEVKPGGNGTVKQLEAEAA
jgi:hypothetical protein